MTLKVDLAAITRDALETAEEVAAPVNDELAARLDQVDLLVADLGQISEFITSSKECVEEAKTDIKWNRIARIWLMLALLAIVAGLSISFYNILVSDPFAVLRNNPTAFSTVAVACIGGIIVIAITVTKAVFMSFDDRHKGVPMPEHLKAVTDPLRDFFGRI